MKILCLAIKSYISLNTHIFNIKNSEQTMCLLYKLWDYSWLVCVCKPLYWDTIDIHKSCAYLIYGTWLFAVNVHETITAIYAINISIISKRFFPPSLFLLLVIIFRASCISICMYVCVYTAYIFVYVHMYRHICVCVCVYSPKIIGCNSC